MVKNDLLACKWQEDDLSLVESKTWTVRLILLEDIPLCLKYSNKNKIYYMHSVEHDNIFIALVATSLGLHDHHQACAMQNLKRMVTCSA